MFQVEEPIYIVEQWFKINCKEAVKVNLNFEFLLRLKFYASPIPQIIDVVLGE